MATVEIAMQGGKIVIAGGSGFLGRWLARYFSSIGQEVIVLSRRPGQSDFAKIVQWDGRTLGDWATELENATALINLAGRSVNCRYTDANRREIMDSRIESTRVLGEAIAQCTHPPQVWLNSSTATIYQHTYGEAWSENGQIGSTPEARDAFSIEVAKEWEAEFERAKTPFTRKVVTRTAVVLGRGVGGSYEILRRLARLGLGGRNSHGRQFFSWIHAHDFCRAVEWLIQRDRAKGVYNLAAPNPLPNAEVMRHLRHAVGMPLGLPATRWMLEIGTFFLRTETELILKSRRVIPRRLLDEGFVFKFREMPSALSDLESEGDAFPTS